MCHHTGHIPVFSFVIIIILKPHKNIQYLTEKPRAYQRDAELVWRRLAGGYSPSSASERSYYG